MKWCLALAVAGLFVVTSSANADYVVHYGWEDGGTILGQYQPNTLSAANVTSPVHELEHSLQLTKLDAQTGGNAYAYLAHITGLETNDVISADFWVYDPASGYPSGRIWGHYTRDGIENYAGSAGGNNTYSSEGWSNLDWTWTFVAEDPGYDPRHELVIDFRTYGTAGQQLWVDDMTITVPNRVGITVTDAGGNVYNVPEPASLMLLALGVLVIRRRR
ncbi:MAG TPA: PEP-CTERM sorting domain-containing protein [Phycisphaerae bacterium]|nr:PEP-CTERM sorting domain-containing protein [Phycisphaerae bacterium]HNU44639.1 PEP-CTERM sorting domain-containing protein [Phycisphaerae bacterium]